MTSSSSVGLSRCTVFFFTRRTTADKADRLRLTKRFFRREYSSTIKDAAAEHTFAIILATILQRIIDLGKTDR